MERPDHAPASDAVSTGISACRHMPTKANWGRFLDCSVPIASLISELSPLPAELPVKNRMPMLAEHQSHLCVNIRDRSPATCSETACVQANSPAWFEYQELATTGGRDRLGRESPGSK